MDRQVEGLEAWEQRLREAELDLDAREHAALSRDPDPAELLALAAERDKVALDRDSIATSYDDLARRRDREGLDRDVDGSERDRRARALDHDLDPGFADRSLAGQDRDDAAGDRGDSFDDRARSREHREKAAANRHRAADDRDAAAERAATQDREIHGLRTALETRTVIGQAQGMLMARHNLSAEAAFAVLARLSQHSNTKLAVLAAQLVATATQPD